MAAHGRTTRRRRRPRCRLRPGPHRLHRGAGWLLVLVMAGCGGGDDAANEAPRWTATRDLRIGSVDDSATALTWIRGMAVDEDGRIYTGHPQESTILVHDADGNRIARVGREGEGPGEFDRLGAFGLRGDTLWAFDYGLYRFTWFTRDGEPLGTLTVPIDLDGDRIASPPRPNGLLPDGRIHGSPPAWSHEVARGTITETPVLLMDTAGAAGDTLFVRPATIWAIQDPRGDVGFGSYRAQPFDDATLIDVSPYRPDYVVVDRAVRDDDAAPTFRVARITFDGDTVFSREIGYAPVPIDPAAPDSLIAGFAESVGRFRGRGAPTEAQAAEWARANLRVPAHHPPVRRFVDGRDGTLWLEREVADPDRVEWLVLDAEGRALGRVGLPRDVHVEVAERGTVWGWELDELDVPYIVRYAVAPSAGHG